MLSQEYYYSIRAVVIKKKRLQRVNQFDITGIDFRNTKMPHDEAKGIENWRVSGEIVKFKSLVFKLLSSGAITSDGLLPSRNTVDHLLLPSRPSLC